MARHCWVGNRVYDLLRHAEAVAGCEPRATRRAPFRLNTPKYPPRPRWQHKDYGCRTLTHAGIAKTDFRLIVGTHLVREEEALPWIAESAAL